MTLSVCLAAAAVLLADAVVSDAQLLPERSKNSSNTMPGAMMPGAMWTRCLNKDRYSPWIRRLRRHTTSDQNRSCKTTLSIPNTKVSSHRPEFTQNHIVSPDPSIRLSTLSAKMTKHTSAASR